MAASYSLTFTCKACGRGTITITNAYEGSGALADATKKNRFAKCDKCGYQIQAKAASLVMVHSGAIGSNTTLTHTVTNGSIVSAAS